MTFLQQIEELKQTWKVLVPSIAAPPDNTFARWVNDFGYEACETAIRRVPWRFRAELNDNQPVEPNHAHKFVTQTMIGLRKRNAQTAAAALEVRP